MSPTYEELQMGYQATMETRRAAEDRGLASADWWRQQEAHAYRALERAWWLLRK